jgi:NADH:ubiquinone oxidoreductase subunit F (NADH-binding)
MAMPLGPQIIFDVVTKSVAVMFDRELVTLKGPFASRTEAMAAAIEECAKRGWLGADHANRADN